MTRQLTSQKLAAGMVTRDWLALVAVHSDAWLLSVAFYHGARLDFAGRSVLFKSINDGPTLFEVRYCYPVRV